MHRVQELVFRQSVLEQAKSPWGRQYTGVKYSCCWCNVSELRQHAVMMILVLLCLGDGWSSSLFTWKYLLHSRSSQDEWYTWILLFFTQTNQAVVYFWWYYLFIIILNIVLKLYLLASTIILFLLALELMRKKTSTPNHHKATKLSWAPLWHELRCRCWGHSSLLLPCVCLLHFS